MQRLPIIACLMSAFLLHGPAQAQQRPTDAAAIARERLVDHGYKAEDLADLVVKDHYRDSRSGVEHTFLRQRWQGIEVFNGDIAIHRTAGGKLIKMDNGAWPFIAKTVDAVSPTITAEQALAEVLGRNQPGVRVPAPTATEDGGRLVTFDGSALGGEPVKVQLMYQPFEGKLRLVWNVNHYEADHAHWWNVRISAVDGKELDRNDWVAHCGFGEHREEEAVHGAAAPAMAAPPAPLPAGANSYNVFPAPVESPSHGSRAVRTAPWAAAGIASPYGWHDTNGATGAEYTITRGNNVWAQEDANGNNGTGYSPDGGSTLDFDFPLDLSGAPSSYRDAAITNLFYWNNLMHDVWYQYGFDEVSGNFQQNNYGRGGSGADYVLADAQDGSGSNNANFATPADGASPRMQMFLWNQTSPQRDGDFDNGIIAHEYGHGISNRLVGGPSNVNCLDNAEQMGEGWSDFFGLMLTMKAGDTRTTSRGVGTYVIGEPVSGTGIRPAPYNTSFSVNNYTYGSTNGMSGEHDIGFVWCTILWEMTWDLVDQYGFDPDLYNGTGGNNIAMQLVIDGLKLTPCSPGFVDGRDAILAADAAVYGGIHQNLIWGAFARRGLGYGASQGSSSSTSDQTGSYGMPLQKTVGVAQATPVGSLFACVGTPVTVQATVKNYGLQDQSGFSVRYSLDGGPYVTESFAGTLTAGATATFTFTQMATINAAGAHTLVVGTVLAGDEYTGDDAVTNQLDVSSATAMVPPVAGDAEGAAVPAGWTLQNPDNSTTWTTATVANGPLCTSTKAWMINYSSYSAIGQEDRLLTPAINLAGASGTRLTFQHAYARYSAAYFDSFRVEVSNDCGSSWTSLYSASGSALATAPDNISGSWAPANCSQWQAHNIDLSAYDGQTVVIRFTGICGYGQRLYFDNVNVFTPAQNDLRVGTILPTGNLRVCGTDPVTVSAIIHNDGSQAQAGFSVQYAVNGGPSVTETFTGTLAAGASQEFTFNQPATFASNGAYTLVVNAVLASDQAPANNSGTSNGDAAVLALAPLPLVGDAEGDAVPAGWTLENPDNSTTWVNVAVTNGPLCNSTKAWMINYYNYSANGQEDRLLTPPVQLPPGPGAELTFQHAYTRYNNNSADVFRVDISSDCGSTWTTLYQASGADLATAPNSTSSSWAPSACAQWQAHNISLDAYAGQTVTVRFTGICAYGQRLYFDNVGITGGTASASATVRMYLGGAYNSADHRMNDQLRANGLVPATEPYTALGFNLPGGGGEIAAVGLLDATGDNAIVDWVVVELRSKTAPGTILSARCALLQRDGDVVAADGSPALIFPVAADDYYVAVRHRNHLGCMAAGTVALGGNAPLVDFGASSTTTHGTGAQQQLDGRQVLWMGDVNHDGRLQYTGAGNDREPMLQAIGGSSPTANATGYLPADVNMDGVVKYSGSANDRDALLQNVGASPSNIRQGQLP